MDTPDVRYVQRPDGVSIAYQVVGDGPVDVLYVPGFVSHLDLQWTDPGFSKFLRRMSSFCRLVLFDKAGTGLSDPVDRVPVLEDRLADMTAVMGAAAMRRPFLVGFSEGGPAAALFAATYPDRVRGLVLYGAICKGRPSAEELASIGVSRDAYEEKVRGILEVADDWGRGRSLEALAPSVAARPAQRRFWALYERASASPAMARALLEGVLDIDVTSVLGAITAPTLVLHHRDEFIPLGNAQILAERIPGARLVVLEGGDHVFWMADHDGTVDEIEQFITGARATGTLDRVLTTVLFTDVVDSTRRAAEVGDAAWRELLERHDRLTRETVGAMGGRVVKSLGDGHLSTFDGPARAVRCAIALRDGAQSDGLPLRAGVHTGECEVIADDIGGLAVHIGSRVCGLAEPSEVLVSGTVKDLVVGSPLAFSDRGEHDLKGVPGRWRLYAADPRGAAPALPAQRELRPGDRLALRLARRAPDLTRSAARVTARLGARRNPG